MATISVAKKIPSNIPLCQGDIYKQVKYNYIDNESSKDVDIVEFEFPRAIIISQACDMIAMSEFVSGSQGKRTKYMPAALMCPIYDKDAVKSGEYLSDVESELNITFTDEKTDRVYTSDDLKIMKKDWHYRFHYLKIKYDEKTSEDEWLIDFKHYFTVSPKYLLENRGKRVCHLDDIYAEQITLKFATYLSRVAIPD